MAEAQRDANRVPTLIAVSSTDGNTPVLLYADPVTHRLLTTSAAGSGDVVGPASSTDNAVVRFDGAGGKNVQNSTVIIGDTGNVTGLGTLNTHTIPAGTSTFAILTNKLDAFAATTSAELRSVISDETGSGVLVFATSPTLTTPNIGVATATSINGLIITASTGTVTLTNGKTLAVTNTLTMGGTDGSTIAFGAGGTVAYVANKLSVFAATTSAELAGVISDETGSGALVFATSPTLVTPALGTPTALVLTNATGLPIAGITGLGANVGTWLGTPSSANLAAAVSDETGTGALVFGTSPTITTPTISGSALLSEGASIALDPAGSADGAYSGITITAVSGYTQAYGDLVYKDPTDSRWEAADANSAAAADGDSRGLLGMVVVAGTDGNACTILLNGVIRADAKFPAFTINNPVYVSETAGSVTQTQPVTTDVVIRVVGFALTADEMYFNPDSGYITHT